MTPEERHRYIEEYQQGPRILQEAYNAAPQEMRDWKPAPDEWSIFEIIQHCADAEAKGGLLLRDLAPKSRDGSTESAFRVIDAVRAWTTPLLLSIPDETWESLSASGDTEPDDWLAVYGHHLHDHAAQIRANIEEWKDQT